MKILIAGVSKTGTTGLLYLIANSMDSKPKLLFEPKECPGQLAFEMGNVIAKVLIGANVNAGSFSWFDKKITLMRDPRDRFISVLLYSQYHANYLADDARVRIMRECLELKESSPSSVSIRKILEVIGSVSGKRNAVAHYRKRARDSLARFDDYVATMPDGLLYKYEDFVAGDYAPLVKHLGMSISGTADVPDELQRVSRTKGQGDWRNWFTEDDVRELRPLFAPWLEKHGYDADDWRLNANPSVNPAHCSLYFRRLVDEYREINSRKAKIVRADQ